jgi:hypothetical protein
MRIFFAIGLLLIVQIGHAYEYEIEEPVLEAASSPGHETLTSLAIDCLNKTSAKDKKPANCLNGQVNIEAYRTDSSLSIPSISDKSISAEEMMDASSWPDDPTRLGSYLGAITNLFQVCDNLWSFLGFDEHYESISGGLACNSHYGLLQFFHAQASSETESYLVTKKKILAWIKFNTTIINDASQLSAPYCSYFAQLKQDEASQEMAAAFLPDDYDDLEQCEENYTLNWIYSSKCKSLIPSEQCDHVGDPRYARITALGAIIHVIQDAYSQSHTKRGQCAAGDKQKPVSKISCTPLYQYYNYNVQDAARHNVSDRLPISVDVSCIATPQGKPEIDDAVTATATVLWYIINQKKPAALIDYLNKSVFFDPYADTDNAVPRPQAGAGACYLPTVDADGMPLQNPYEADFKRRLQGR